MSCNGMVHYLLPYRVGDPKDSEYVFSILYPSHLENVLYTSRSILKGTK